MKSAGLAINHGEATTFESAGNIAPGQVVGLDSNGQVAPALSDSQSGTTDVGPIVGVVANTVDPNHAAGARVRIYVGGTIVTAVTGGVAGGEELGISATAGTLTTGTGAGRSFSAAGGEHQGPMPAGHAAVRLP